MFDKAPLALFDVYRLRRVGVKLTRDELLHTTPARGRLELRPRSTTPPILLAMLCDDDYNYVVPCLDRAHVARVRDGRLLIRGMETHPKRGRPEKAGANYCPQAWVCVPVPLPPLDQL